MKRERRKLHLDAGIILQKRRIGRVERVPVVAVGRELVKVHGRRNARKLLEELDAESLRGVPMIKSSAHVII